MAKETMKYETAIREIESIVSRMESGDMEIDELCAQLKTAQKLIKMCRDRLTKTEAEINTILKPDEGQPF